MYSISQVLFAAVLQIPPCNALQTIQILKHIENES